MGDLLPPLPVDDASLDLYWQALHPGPEAERSSLFDMLAFYSAMAGSDPDAIEEVIEGREGDGIDAAIPAVHVMRYPQYGVHDLISALITEIRRLREAAQSGRDHPVS